MQQNKIADEFSIFATHSGQINVNTGGYLKVFALNFQGKVTSLIISVPVCFSSLISRLSRKNLVLILNKINLFLQKLNVFFNPKIETYICFLQILYPTKALIISVVFACSRQYCVNCFKQRCWFSLSARLIFHQFVKTIYVCLFSFIFLVY